MDKLPMSPQMKTILLSFKKIHFKKEIYQDNEGNRIRSFKEEEKDLDIYLSEESCQSDNICSAREREKERNTREAVCTPSRGAVRQRRGSWIVPKHILSRSNTVDVLPLQKSGEICYSSTRCKESVKVFGSVTLANSTLRAQSVAEGNANYEKRMKPKSAPVIRKPLSSDLFPRHPLYQTKAGRVGSKPCSVVIKRGTTAKKADNMWENLSDQRTFLINKWLSPAQNH